VEYDEKMDEVASMQSQASKVSSMARMKNYGKDPTIT